MYKHLTLALTLLVTVAVAACSESDELGKNQQGLGFDPVLHSGDWEPAVGTPVVRPTIPPDRQPPPPPAFGPEIACNNIDEDGDGFDLCSGDADDDGVPAEYDCDDLNANISPRHHEVRCDGIDQNCDGYDDCDRDNDGVLDRDDCDADDPTSQIQCHLPPNFVAKPLN